MSACPQCGTGLTKVIDSRYLPNGLTRRRRECQNGCGHRWNTLEIPDHAIDAESLADFMAETFYKHPAETT